MRVCIAFWVTSLMVMGITAPAGQALAQAPAAAAAQSAAPASPEAAAPAEAGKAPTGAPAPNQPVPVAATAAPAAIQRGTAGLPVGMWQRIRAAEPTAVDLKPTPTPQAPATLSLTECVGLAFGNNAGFRRDQQNLVNVTRGMWVADQRIFFDVTAQAQRDRSPGGQVDSAHSASASARWELLAGDSLRFGVGTGTQDVFGDLITQRPAFNATYNRPLIRGVGLASSTWERVRSARVALANGELSFYDARQSLMLTVIDDYFSVLLAQGEVEIAQRAVERAKRFYDINYMKSTGEGLKQPGETWVSQVAEIDVDQARLSWKRAQESLSRQQQAYRDAMDSLLLDIGLLPGATPQLTTLIAYSPQEFDREALVRTALANSTDLASLNLDREDTVAARRIAYSNNRPDLIASLGFSNAGETLAGQTVSEGYLAALRVEAPLWNRGRGENKARADRSLSVLDQAIAKARDRVAKDMERLVRAANSSKARIAIDREAADLARKNREQAQGMYEEGLSDYLRVLDAEDRLVEAERTVLQEEVQYFLNAVRIRRALGEDISQGLPQ